MRRPKPKRRIRLRGSWTWSVSLDPIEGVVAVAHSTGHIKRGTDRDAGLGVELVGDLEAPGVGAVFVDTDDVAVAGRDVDLVNAIDRQPLDDGTANGEGGGPDGCASVLVIGVNAVALGNKGATGV